MIKDILVRVPTERPLRPVIDMSIAQATDFGAHLDALALGYAAERADGTSWVASRARCCAR
jgi:hypothetical protein